MNVIGASPGRSIAGAQRLSDLCTTSRLWSTSRLSGKHDATRSTRHVSHGFHAWPIASAARPRGGVRVDATVRRAAGSLG
jgi:hypothetical protein